MWISDAFNYNRGRKFQLWADIEGAPLIPGVHFEAGKLQLDWRCAWMISILGFMVPFYSAGVMNSLNLLYDNGRVLNSCAWTLQRRNPVKADSTASRINAEFNAISWPFRVEPRKKMTPPDPKKAHFWLIKDKILAPSLRSLLWTITSEPTTGKETFLGRDSTFVEMSTQPEGLLCVPKIWSGAWAPWTMNF